MDLAAAGAGRHRALRSFRRSRGKAVLDGDDRCHGDESITGLTANAELGSASWAAATASSLHTAGYAPNVTAIDWPAYAGGPRGLEGYRVRTGDFPTHAAAATLAPR